MNCSNCGAPLPPTSNICQHCNTLNDTDLRAIDRRASDSETSQRICPRCSDNLVTMNIGGQQTLSIDRCPQCLGIFFDRGELETVMDDSVTRVYEIDHQRLHELSENERQVSDFDKSVRYVRCPACQTMMNRHVFGTRSGVIVDRCRAHGVWLDAGELGQLLRWMKAGGQLYHEKRKADEQRAAEVARRVKSNIRLDQATRSGGYRWTGTDVNSLDGTALTGVMRIIGQLLW